MEIGFGQERLVYVSVPDTSAKTFDIDWGDPLNEKTTLVSDPDDADAGENEQGTYYEDSGSFRGYVEATQGACQHTYHIECGDNRCALSTD